jgi:hypothetical protein
MGFNHNFRDVTTLRLLNSYGEGVANNWALYAGRLQISPYEKEISRTRLEF